MPSVLVIEDDFHARTQLEWALKDEFDVLTAGDPATALGLAREHPAAIVLDLGLPPRPTDPEEGIQLLRELRKCSSWSRVVVCTGYGQRKHAVQAVGDGVYDFLQKPVDIDLLRSILRRACWLSELEQEWVAELPAPEAQEMIGTSDVLRVILTMIRKVATTDVPVLITGESGTGKELAAKAIHERSVRHAGPFIPINCGAIPETLLEAELFGHEKGAFTGAARQKKGRLERAEGGTLFLDEIGELPVALQVKLLRFLQDQTLERVGGLHPIPVNARIIAATNTNLEEAIVRGTFREDLYYRLGVVHIHMPPLRDRGDDVLVMAMAFLKQASDEAGRQIHGFTKEACRAIQAYSWPGNVRELSNSIRRAVVMADRPYVSAEDLGIPARAQQGQHVSLRAARERLEIDLIGRALTRYGNNRSRVANELGISRPTLYALLRKYKFANTVANNGG